MKAPGLDGEDDGDEIERDGAEGTPAAAAAAATLQFPGVGSIYSRQIGDA